MRRIPPSKNPPVFRLPPAKGRPVSFAATPSSPCPDRSRPYMWTPRGWVLVASDEPDSRR